MSRFHFKKRDGNPPRGVKAEVKVEADGDLPDIVQRPEVGMNEEPCASYGLGSRLRCARCGGQPRIMRVDGNGPVTITASCCGQTETRTLEKKELTFTQYFFEEEA